MKPFLTALLAAGAPAAPLATPQRTGRVTVGKTPRVRHSMASDEGMRPR